MERFSAHGLIDDRDTGPTTLRHAYLDSRGRSQRDLPTRPRERPSEGPEGGDSAALMPDRSSRAAPAVLATTPHLDRAPMGDTRHFESSQRRLPPRYREE